MAEFGRFGILVDGRPIKLGGRAPRPLTKPTESVLSGSEKERLADTLGIELATCLLAEFADEVSSPS